MGTIEDGSTECRRRRSLGAIKAVADAVGRGGITPAEGFALSQMIESFPAGNRCERFR
jgi:hypothetical protein